MSLDYGPYHQVSVGEQLGHLEYVVTEDALAAYRRAVDYPEALYASIAAKEYAEALTRKHGLFPAISVKHEDKYYSHPRIDKRVQATGWAREKYRARGRDWLMVETLAIDEDGREVVRSKHTLLVGGLPRGDKTSAKPQDRPVSDQMESLQKTVTRDTISRFEALSRSLRGREDTGAAESIHTSEQAAKARGLKGPVASGQLSFAYLHELLDRTFGVDFRQGGQLSAAFLAPVYPGDALTGGGGVTGEAEVDGRRRFSLEVWLENQQGARTAVGRATVTVPSPLT